MSGVTLSPNQELPGPQTYFSTSGHLPTLQFPHRVNQMPQRTPRLVSMKLSNGFTSSSGFRRTAWPADHSSCLHHKRLGSQNGAATLIWTDANCSYRHRSLLSWEWHYSFIALTQSESTLFLSLSIYFLSAASPLVEANRKLCAKSDLSYRIHLGMFSVKTVPGTEGIQCLLSRLHEMMYLVTDLIPSLECKLSRQRTLSYSSWSPYWHHPCHVRRHEICVF